jgi:hypothetical protein
LVVGKHGCTALCHTRMYQSGGIVVGAFHLLQFNKRLSDERVKRQSGFIFEQRKAVFSYLGNCPYFLT